MRLIDADELIVIEYGGIKFVPKEFIDEAPTIDAVPVVRCKDCVNAHMTIGGECRDCDEWEEDEPLYLSGDFFCAFGQRKAEP